MRLFEFTIDNKRIACPRDSDILIQVGKGKGSYKTRYTFKAYEIGKAILYYKGINVGNGYKKRLIMPSLNKPVLGRVIS